MDQCVKIIEEYWPRKVIGFIVLPLVVSLAIFTPIAAVTPEAVIPYVVAISCIFGAGSSLIWYLVNRIPKHPSDTVGFDLVLIHESKEHGQKIQADFCIRLRELLKAPGSSSNFNFIEHSQHVCREYLEKDDIAKLCDKTKSMFTLYGRTKLRQIEGEEQHVLELSGRVRHAPIKADISDKIAREMRDALGAEVVIAQENDLFSFRVTATRIEIATKYIVSLAALASGDIDYSEILLTELKKRFAEDESRLNSDLAKIKNRIPIRLGEVGIIKCQRLADQFAFGENDNVLHVLEKELDKYRQYNKNWLSGYLLSAICCFELRRDVKAAKKLVLQCKMFPDTTWCYSMAFLCAYEGNLQKAWSYYQKGFRKLPSDPSVPNQCESFINTVISREPEKVQLWYCLGLINLKAKNDLGGAKRDFGAFLANTKSGMFDAQRKIATRYIRKIDAELGAEKKVITLDNYAA